MDKKTKKEKIELFSFDRQRKIFSESGVSHSIFTNVSTNQTVTDKTEKGTRLLVARYPDFYKIYLYKYMPPETEGYPRGGVKVWNQTFEQMQHFYFESVAIHPDGGLHKFYSKESDEE